MKKLILTLIMFFLSYGIALSSCYEDCDDPPYNSGTVVIPIQNSTCYIEVKFEYRLLNCGDEIVYDLKIIGVAGALDTSCAEITYPIALFETAVSYIIGYPHLNPFPMPDPGNCITSYRVAGPSCWELVYLLVGPSGEAHYLLPCAETPLCCRPYKVCQSIHGVVQVIPLSYTPVSCASVIGPETNQPCESTCPN
jgi:hypothetical protein